MPVTTGKMALPLSASTTLLTSVVKGGEIVVLGGDPSKQHIDMDDVPKHIYEKALGLARIQATQRIPPSFDLRVVGGRASS